MITKFCTPPPWPKKCPNPQPEEPASVVFAWPRKPRLPQKREALVSPCPLPGFGFAVFGLEFLALSLGACGLGFRLRVCNFSFRFCACEFMV